MRLGAYIDVSLMPPRPERLVEICEYLASLELDAVFIEWGTLFPWEFDDRVRGEMCFSDDTVIGLHRELTRRKIEHIPVLSAANPAFLRCDPLFPALSSDDGDTEGCVKRLVVTMLEDMRALLPDVARVCLNALSGGGQRSALRARESRIIGALADDLRLLRFTAVTLGDEGETWSSTEVVTPRSGRAVIDAPVGSDNSWVRSPEWRLAAIADRVRVVRPRLEFSDATRNEYDRAVKAARALAAFESAVRDAWFEYRAAAESIASATASRERVRADSTLCPALGIETFGATLRHIDDAVETLFESTRHGIDAAVFERRVGVIIEPLREAYESCRSRARVLGFRFGAQPEAAT